MLYCCLISHGWRHWSESMIEQLDMVLSAGGRAGIHQWTVIAFDMKTAHQTVDGSRSWVGGVRLQSSNVSRESGLLQQRHTQNALVHNCTAPGSFRVVRECCGLMWMTGVALQKLVLCGSETELVLLTVYRSAAVHVYRWLEIGDCRWDRRKRVVIFLERTYRTDNIPVRITQFRFPRQYLTSVYHVSQYLTSVFTSVSDFRFSRQYLIFASHVSIWLSFLINRWWKEFVSTVKQPTY